MESHPGSFPFFVVFFCIPSFLGIGKNGVRRQDSFVSTLFGAISISWRRVPPPLQLPTPLTATPQDRQELKNFYAVHPLPENVDQVDPRVKHLIWGPPTIQFLRRTGRNCLSVATARVREVPHVRNCLCEYVIYERGYVFSSQNQAFSGMEMDTVAIHKKMWWLRKRLSVLSRWSMDLTA